jgi:hypothetical protein
MRRALSFSQPSFYLAAAVVQKYDSASLNSDAAR